MRIPANGIHNYGEWQTIVEPTCHEEGSKQRVCQTEGCTQKESKKIEATGQHSYGDWIIVTKPTCYQNGQKKRVCQTDGCIGMQTDVILATGEHVYGEYKLDVSPDCIHKGTEKSVCQTKGCSSFESREIEATGVHLLGEWVVIRKATTQETGVAKRTCKVEGCEEFEEKELPIIENNQIDDSKQDDENDKENKEDDEVDDPKEESEVILNQPIKLGKVSCNINYNKIDKTVTIVRLNSTSMSSISIPATVKIDGKTYKVTAIEKSAFANNKKLKSLTIGSNIQTIGAKAFYNCRNLKKITIKSKKLIKQSVGKYAFKGTHKNAVVKVPASRKKAYNTLLLSRGINKKAIIKN